MSLNSESEGIKRRRSMNMKIRKYLAVLLALIMGIAVLSSCSKSESGKDQTSEVVLRVTTTWEESWWDPALFMSVSDAYLAANIYENLVELKEDGTVGPYLAEKYEVSGDGLKYTFNLRKGVQWHKGYGEMTSEDVKFTLERQSDPAVASVNAQNLQIDNIASIECPDKYTVIVNLKTPDVDLLNRLAEYYGIIVCKAHSDKDGVASINTDPIGTGPYSFASGTLGIKTEVVKNDKWWGKFTGNVDRIICTFISDTNAIYSAFENNELDMIGVFSKDKTRELSGKGYLTKPNPLRQLLYIGVNMQLAPFDDPLVREALFCAIDPDYYLNDFFYGEESAVGSYLPPSSKYAVKDYFKNTYDPDKAKQLLTDAGYPNGLEVMMWGANDSLGQPPSIIAQDMLNKSGFKVELQSVDFGVWITSIRDGTAPLWVAYNTTSAIGDDTVIRYQSSYYPGNNWCGVTDKAYDDFVQAGLAASTEKEKYDNFYAAQKRMMDLQVIYPVSTFTVATVMQKNVSGVVSYGDQGFRAHMITIAKS